MRLSNPKLFALSLLVAGSVHAAGAPPPAPAPAPAAPGMGRLLNGEVYHLPGYRQTPEAVVGALEASPFTSIRRAEKRDFSALVKKLQSSVRGVIVDPVRGGRIRLRDQVLSLGSKLPYERVLTERDRVTGSIREKTVPGKLTLREVSSRRLRFLDEDDFAIDVPLDEQSTGRFAADVIVASGLLVHPQGLVLAPVEIVRDASGDVVPVKVYTLYGREEALGVASEAAYGLGLLQLRHPPKGGFPYAPAREVPLRPGETVSALVYQAGGVAGPGGVRAAKLTVVRQSAEGMVVVAGVVPVGTALLDEAGAFCGMVVAPRRSGLEAGHSLAAGPGALKGIGSFIAASERKQAPWGSARELTVAVAGVPENIEAVSTTPMP